MADEKKSLLLFQLGPVQSFIAQAITLEDLAVGSHLLSQVTAAALQSIIKECPCSSVVFPNKDGNEALQGIPNRFLIFVQKDRAKELAQSANNAAQKELKKLAKKARDAVDDKDAFDKQISAFLQITWAILENPTGQMGEDYRAIGKLMAMRRNTREFEAWSEREMGKPKDILSGKEQAISDGLGAMNLIKRYKTEESTKVLQITEELKNADYIAVIAMDGDKMGATLSSFNNEKEHREFSEKLGKFANGVKEDIPVDGLLIYAGGDDVLAIVKATDAIGVAKTLSDKFKMVVGNTASAGIAIGHTSVPLQALVHAAHDAESRAKQVYGRDALAININKRSGEILEWGCKWDSPALDLYRELTTLSELNEKKEINIGRFPYKLAALLQPYTLKGVLDRTMQDIVMAEYDHAVEQTKDMRKDKVDRLPRETVKTYLEKCSENRKIEDFLNLFMVETFINRPREGENDE